MRLSMLVLCLLSAATLAQNVDMNEMLKYLRENPWVIEYSLVAGHYSLEGRYPSKEACQAALSALPDVPADRGHCVEWKDGHFVGSWNPKEAGKK